MKLKVDAEFEQHLMPLSDSEIANLEQNLLEEGVQDAIKVWEGKGIIVDGHNRYRICQKHDLEFCTEELHFEDREDVLDWIDRRQISQRNVSPADFKLISGRIYNRKKAKNPVKSPNHQFDGTGNTAESVASELGSSAPTIERNGRRAEVVDSLIEAGEVEAAEVAKTAPQKVIDEAKGESPEVAAKVVKKKPKNKEKKQDCDYWLKVCNQHAERIIMHSDDAKAQRNSGQHERIQKLTFEIMECLKKW